MSLLAMETVVASRRVASSPFASWRSLHAALAYEKAEQAQAAVRFFCRYVEESSLSRGREQAIRHVTLLGGKCGGGR